MGRSMKNKDHRDSIVPRGTFGSSIPPSPRAVSAELAASPEREPED
jgi:hypothetical protein